ncbi:MAG: hypothetical protein KF882_04390 [Bacteroidia bacterium]|nr:hypothetical protein [Bacteroidia bacterium]MCO5254811.1 hypothetical protein [Bacteroidota bacterium]
MNIIGLRNGVFAFIIVLLLMPIGHALMVLNEQILVGHKYLGAFLMGILGVVIFIIGIFKDSKPTFATLMGLVGGILVWTGWIEFSFVWIAEKNNVAPLMEAGEIATKPEYLVMLSSIGLLLTVCLFYLFSRNNCTFFIWFQKYFRFRDKIVLSQSGFKKPLAVSTFSESIMILWFFYILLLVVYDEQIAGDRHPATFIVGFGSLLWSIYLIAKLIKIQSFDYAIRYAIPTVIIFWNFIEVIGRWDLFKEIWVHPLEYWWQVSLFFIAFAALFVFFIISPKFQRKQKHAHVNVSK